MSESRDIRWEQRFANYTKAFYKLDEAVTRIVKDFGIQEDGTINGDDFLDDIIKEGVIQRFEYTHELAWKVMKDFLKERGNPDIYGSKDATREAVATGLIQEARIWMEMVKSRNKTSQTYNEETAIDIFLNILNHYHSAFLAFQKTMEEKRSNEKPNLS